MATSSTRVVPARSAIVRETGSTRWYPRARLQRLCHSGEESVRTLIDTDAGEDRSSRPQRIAFD
jgi:hypothetical protein